MYSYGCDVTDELKKADIEVKENRITNLGAIIWATNNYKKLWQIGIADRFTDGFKYSDHQRYYDVFKHVPANLDYTIGQSNPANDWYYAQTQTGAWNILFKVTQPYQGEGVLTVGIAGAAKNAQYQVWLNGKMLGKYYFGNDASIYRSAIRGGYYRKLEVRFPADQLTRGDNKISLVMPNCKPGGGIMYDVVKLEVDDKPAANK